MKVQPAPISDLHSWLAGHPLRNEPGARELLRRAVEQVGELSPERRWPGPEHHAKDHLLSVLQILDGLRSDGETLAAAVLYHGVRQGVLDAGTIEECYPARVAELVAGLDRVAQIDHLETPAGERQHGTEGLRRLLLALVRDVRVVLVKLADQLAWMRSLAYGPPALQQRFARQTFELYAPLANRLGIWQVKWELEDLAFRFLHPATYKRIAQQLAESRRERERYINEVIGELQRHLRAEGLRADVAGRPKHIYSIWRKMQRKQLDIEQLFDLRAVRVLVDDVQSCYATLGLVHALWRYIPGEFDDYIANPKSNLYRALHTAVIGPEGKTLEIQIKTHEMHEHAELGVAAHWRYKEDAARDPSYDRKILWMRQLLEGGEEPGDDGSLLAELAGDVGEDRVYVLTPKGEVVDLPQGSTVLDFAYHIHTDVGHRCRGAKVNGRIVPLTYRVETAQRVEVITARNAEPSRDWLSPQLGYLHSARSRAKVRQYFKRLDRDRHLREGRELLDKELSRLGLDDARLGDVLGRFNLQRVEDLEVAIGRGDVTPAQVARALEDLNRRESDELAELPRIGRAEEKSSADRDVTIEGVGDLMTSLAQCCKPVPGDPIVGYITKGRGVSIHRLDCGNMSGLRQQGNPRLIDVDWGGRTRGRYPVDVLIRAYDRKGLLRDVSTLLASLRVDVMDIQSHVDRARGVAETRVTVQIENMEQLSRLLSKLTALPNVTLAQRVVH